MRTFSVQEREDLALLARQFPSYFISFQDDPTDVLTDIDALVQSALAQHFPRFTCVICRSTFTNRIEALSHAQAHPRPNTRQQQRSCLSTAIRDSSYTIYSCHKCTGTYTNKWALIGHMHSHAERKIYRCRICPHGGQYFCQLLEHILRKHASRSNLHCLECPLGHSPYFTNTHAYLTHLSVTHKNNLAKHLCNIFSETPELPVNLEVSTTILCIISY